MKHNSNEEIGYLTTLLQPEFEKVYSHLEDLANQLMVLTIPEDQINADQISEEIEADYMTGLLDKLVYRHENGEWPTGTYSL